MENYFKNVSNGPIPELQDEEEEEESTLMESNSVSVSMMD